MNQLFRRDHTNIDHDAVRRRRALSYGIDELKRANNAIATAAQDEPRAMRQSVLQDAQRRLASTLRELQALE